MQLIKTDFPPKMLREGKELMELIEAEGNVSLTNQIDRYIQKVPKKLPPSILKKVNFEVARMWRLISKGKHQVPSGVRITTSIHPMPRPRGSHIVDVTSTPRRIRPDQTMGVDEYFALIMSRSEIETDVLGGVVSYAQEERQKKNAERNRQGLGNLDPRIKNYEVLDASKLLAYIKDQCARALVKAKAQVDKEKQRKEKARKTRSESASAAA